MQYSIVQSSETELTSVRLDAEYYQPLFLETEKKLKSGKWDYLKNLTESIKSFGAYSLCNQVEYKENGIPFLRCKDIKNGLIDFSNVLYIDSDANKLLWKSEIKPQTVLFTMSGTVGNSAITTEEMEYPINSNQDIAKIITNKKLNPYYFSVFLQCTHGTNQISRLPVGSVQQHIFLWQLDKIIVPLLADEFQSDIEHLLKFVLSLQKKSNEVYEQAQIILLSELGLVNWKSKHQLAYVKNYSVTLQAGRVDAEYYQPKYEEIINAIKGYPGGWDTLGNLTHLKTKNFQPEDNIDYIYIELANIASNGEITDCMTEQGHSLPSRARRKVAKGDVIVSSVEGSLSSIALIKKEYDQALCSTGFHVINSETFSSETLLVLMKSIVGQLQLKKGCSGTILTAINRHEFCDIVLPLISEEKQLDIKQKVTESFHMRKQSKRMLECAKRAVEIAIEQNEETAMGWLHTQTQDIMHDGQNHK